MDVSLPDAAARLDALVAEAERGAPVTLTRGGVPVARIVPVPPPHDREAAHRAVEGLRGAARGLSLGGFSIKDLINEGRR